VATGSEVVASVEFGMSLLDRDRSYVAVEMESGGASISAHRRAESVPVLVLRGISDFSDERKEELDQIASGWPAGAWRTYACQNAADLLRVLVEQGDLPLPRPGGAPSDAEFLQPLGQASNRPQIRSSTVAGRLAAQAESDRVGKGNLLLRCVLLAVESMKRAPNPDTEATLRRALSLLAMPHYCLKHAGWVDAIAFSADGKKIVTASGDHSAGLWNALTGSEIAFLEHDDWVGSAAISRRGDRVATGSDDCTARVWDAVTGKMLAIVRHDNWVRSVAFLDDGRLLMSASGDGTVGVWNAHSGDAVARLTHGDWVRTADVAAHRIVSGSDDCTARVWNAISGEELQRLVHNGPVRWVKFSPDGNLIATASDDRTARVWNAWDGAELARVTHSESVGVATFNFDGSRVATASDDHSGRVFDASTGAEIALLQHEDVVWSVAFSPDGARVVTGSDDHTARVWVSDTGEELARIVHDDAIGSVTFSPDGDFVATASDDGTGRVWRVPAGTGLTRLKAETADASADRLIQLACDRVTRNLTRDEWARFLPAESYRATCSEVE
jgi:WD40 repeat protein